MPRRTSKTTKQPLTAIQKGSGAGAAITPEELAEWWTDNGLGPNCLDTAALASLAQTIDDFRQHYALYRTKERVQADANQRYREREGLRFKKIIRERQRFWGSLGAARLEYETAKAAETLRPAPDADAMRNAPFERLCQLLKVIEDTHEFWNGPPARARDRQERADWHLSAWHLDRRIGPIWRAAGLTVSYGPNTTYAKLLASSICRATGWKNICAENIQAAFRRRDRKKIIGGFPPES